MDLSWFLGETELRLRVRLRAEPVPPELPATTSPSSLLPACFCSDRRVPRAHGWV